MNYFAHGYRFIDRPYKLAGTALPDWLNVVDRKAKARSKTALAWQDDSDPRIAQLAGGIIQHHHDDRWFHATRSFVELSMEFSLAIRECLNNERGYRSGFVGHVLVELLLDAYLIEQAPSRLDEYYRAVGSLDPDWFTNQVSRMTTKPVPQMGRWIERFRQEGFLYDYLDDNRLLWRLNHLMRRVKLPALPAQLVELITVARRRVHSQAEPLLSEPTQISTHPDSAESESNERPLQ